MLKRKKKHFIKIDSTLFKVGQERTMKNILLLTFLALVSGRPAGDEEFSLIPVPDLTSGSASAYWSAECGGRTPHSSGPGQC